jgi:threonine 3-dehydrogenase
MLGSTAVRARAVMKALRKMSVGPGLSLETVPVPTIGQRDVLVRTKIASICGTDMHIYNWDRWPQSRIKPPLTLGHEFCGTVEAIGDEVEDLDPGDLVSAEMHVQCGHCQQCRLGKRTSAKTWTSSGSTGTERLQSS